MELFYDLCCQDLPPAFEDNLQGLTSLLEKYLKFENPFLNTDDDAEVGVLENVKAEIFETKIAYRWTENVVSVVNEYPAHPPTRNQEPA